MERTCHIPVLEREVIDLLRAEQKGEFLDCTLGGGGHSIALLNAHKENSLVAIDRDARAIIRANRRLEKFDGRVGIMHSTFSDLKEALKGRRFDGMLADLGVSSDQLKERRGFSFADASELDMRMDESQELTAHEVVNKTTERDLYALLRRGGIGTEAKRIAQAIVHARPIERSDELANLMKTTFGARYRAKKGHPATVVFQAIRIAVNAEYEELDALLEAAPHLVKAGGRFAVISFHSDEDKRVTRRMREWQTQGRYPALWRGVRKDKPLGELVTKKAVVPSAKEVKSNPASRSARLRVFEFFE